MFERWEQLIKVNQIIRDIAANWVPDSSGDGVQWVLKNEWGNFTNQIIWNNAKHLESEGRPLGTKQYNISIPDFTKHDGWEKRNVGFLFERLTRGSEYWVPLISMVCDSRVVLEKGHDIPSSCIRNKISPDGMHWCTETVGARYSASIACLAGCVYNGNELNRKEKDTSPNRLMNLQKCEQSCNDQFMSLVPVDEKWVEDTVTIFSNS